MTHISVLRRYFILIFLEECIFNFYIILAWTFVVLFQIHAIVCQSGRRSDQYRHIQEATPKEISVINQTVPTDRIDLQSSSDQSSKIIDVNEQKIYSSIKNQPQKLSSTDITKIKTLLPYVIIKRAYSKLKNGKYNGDENRMATKDSISHKSPYTSSRKHLINNLCKLSGTSICRLVSYLKQQTKHFFIRLLFIVIYFIS